MIRAKSLRGDNNGVIGIRGTAPTARAFRELALWSSGKTKKRYRVDRAYLSEHPGGNRALCLSGFEALNRSNGWTRPVAGPIKDLTQDGAVSKEGLPWSPKQKKGWNKCNRFQSGKKEQAQGPGASAIL